MDLFERLMAVAFLFLCGSVTALAVAVLVAVVKA